MAEAPEREIEKIMVGKGGATTNLVTLMVKRWKVVKLIILEVGQHCMVISMAGTSIQTFKLRGLKR